MNSLRTGIEARMFESRTVAQVLGLKLVSLPEKIEGGFILLASFRVPSLVVQVFGLIGEGREGCEGDQQ